ncbi:MAG: peptide ABC transporter ATP-binding protein [Spirochaetae bacterium HGW-Spirochaetae-3]|jgi:oligopeptide transport system ATP-binding protein|nr:MAG: peptide ABC transporter ATP-binding protein [Spirochaetae bacterium HGW-Spirochaetae-3]
MTDDVILQVKDLKAYFKLDEGLLKAVDGVSFDLRKGETLGIVGESGSGKSVTNLAIMRLIPSPPGRIAGGEVEFMGKDILKMSEEEVRKIRGNKISMIFQDPMTCLNPFLRISTQMVETIVLHQGLDKKAAKDKAIEMLKLAGIPAPEKRIDQYPHQFSGGMRQRVMIAMALSCEPEILIADEPTTALDVTIQAQILELINDLSARLGTAVILITHSLGVVAGMCDAICVMYAGRIVERGNADEIFADPKHPYTQGLIKSVPRLDKISTQRLYSIPGQPPNVINLPDCCPFFPRCERAMDVCKTKYPKVAELSAKRSVACWLYGEGK